MQQPTLMDQKKLLQKIAVTAEAAILMESELIQTVTLVMVDFPQLNNHYTRYPLQTSKASYVMAVSRRHTQNYIQKLENLL